MKNRKRVSALLLSAVMVLTTGLTSWAEEPAGALAAETPAEGTSAANAQETAGSITLSGAKAGHTYGLYQIFAGGIENGALVDITWGKDAPESLREQYADAEKAAAAVEEQNNALAFAKSLNLWAPAEMKELDEDGTLEFKNLDPGYYIITDYETGTDNYSSPVVVKVVGNVTGAMKGSVPAAHLKLADWNDTLSYDINDMERIPKESGGWNIYMDSADYDIGDEVYLTMFAETADNVSSFKKYHITFQCNLPEGMEDPGAYEPGLCYYQPDELYMSYKLKKEEIETYTSNYRISSDEDRNVSLLVRMTTQIVEPETGYDFAVRFEFTPNTGETNDANADDAEAFLPELLNNRRIRVVVRPRLAESAVIGAEGNPAYMHILYSSDPENENAEGKTLDDKATVFTYALKTDKVDPDGAQLKGADFMLYKEVTSNDHKKEVYRDGKYVYEYPKTGADIKAAWADNVKSAAAALADDKYYFDVQRKTVTDESTFRFDGIDDGKYVLVETKVPSGYAAWNATEVTVESTHEEESEDPKLLTLKAGAPFTEENAEAGTVTRKGGSTYERPSGEIYGEVINKKGAQLPETGGTGTAMFYIIGSILMFGAGTVMASKRRMVR